MPDLDYSYKKRRGWSTKASSTVDIIHLVVKPQYETPTALPAAGDTISVAEFFGGLKMRSLAMWVPDGKVFGGGATQVGWKLLGNYPGHDTMQNPYHKTPNVTGIAPVREDDYFGTGTPGATRTQLITNNWKDMSDYEHNGHKLFRNYQFDLTITPAGALAADDELMIEVEYMLDSK